MIVLETLFILLSQFLIVASEENNTGGFYREINTTVLPIVSNISSIPSSQVQYNASSSITEQPSATRLPDVDDSTVTPGPNDKLDYSSVLLIATNVSPTPSFQVQYIASSSITEQPPATGLPNVNDSIVKRGPNDKLDNSSYEETSAFFSKSLVERFRAWNNTLENASKQCIKELIELHITGSITEESVEIKFPVFQGEDIDLYFLTLETVHPVLVREKSGHDLVNVAYLSILELWPLLVLCFTCAALSGMILWLLVSIN